jgi:hypothetical protein
VYGVTPLPIPSRDTAPFGLGLAPSSTPLGRLRNRALYGLFDRVLFRDVHAHYNRVRARAGLPASPAGVFNDAVSPHLYLQGTVASFEYPRSDLPPQIHFIGPFLPGPSPDFTPPAWWDELRAAEWPVVHVTQGTITTDPSQLLIPTLQALAGQEVLVVATTGGQPADTIPLTPLPANVRLAPFIPYFHLLPQVDVMVTNGGYGGCRQPWPTAYRWWRPAAPRKSPKSARASPGPGSASTSKPTGQHRTASGRPSARSWPTPAINTTPNGWRPTSPAMTHLPKRPRCWSDWQPPNSP